MANYYRITAYHPDENLLVIMDSNGMFDKLWKFSAFMVSKGFRIIEVGDDEKFDFGDMPKAEYNADQIFLRAVCSDMPKQDGNHIDVAGKRYSVTKEI